MTPGKDIDPDEPEIAPLEADRGFEDYEVAANALGIRRLMTPKLVLVEWSDPWSVGGWMEWGEAIRSAEDPERGVCQTAGWIIKEAADYILIVGSLGLSFDGDDRQVGDVFKLPRNCIRDIKVLFSGKPCQCDRADGFA